MFLCVLNVERSWRNLFPMNTTYPTLLHVWFPLCRICLMHTSVPYATPLRNQRWKAVQLQFPAVVCRAGTLYLSGVRFFVRIHTGKSAAS